MWFKVDDQLSFSPKVVQAGNKAMGLWVRAGAWCGLHGTDGHVPTEMIPALGGTNADAKTLVQAGLWDKSGSGYTFHDWGEYQPDAASVKAAQEAREQAGSESGSYGNHVRWHVKRNLRVAACEFCNPDG